MEVELQQQIVDNMNVEIYKVGHREELDHQRQATERDQQIIDYETGKDEHWRQNFNGDAQAVQGEWDQSRFYLPKATEEESE